MTWNTWKPPNIPQTETVHSWQRDEWRSHLIWLRSKQLVSWNKLLYNVKTGKMGWIIFACTYKNIPVHACSVAQSCTTLYDPMDCSPPGFSVHGISQARRLEWVAISYSRWSSWSGTHVSCVSCIDRRNLSHIVSNKRNIKWQQSSPDDKCIWQILLFNPHIHNPAFLLKRIFPLFRIAVYQVKKDTFQPLPPDGLTEWDGMAIFPKFLGALFCSTAGPLFPCSLTSSCLEYR